ncbi:MAG: hypothetical protein A2887_04145 [Alphaproteobacteria bacterium RIFCSPLOWO2_01_FULL_40_26]|nr:MAG: hypothetical protein A2794_00385 [Alphaproteobacteria bacterium RIFCSPHIGHO2_01_FULL_40_8]OFW93927.1 MAG: hypothetical protein A2887_04145 [Alphaproteobacteria bacterium RIFCSPLOWO2_01_FULL_40_26]OFX09421.1 MAG: hypothetical protein A3H30_01760 [Alphaproteobacteria bacterium RIFCSPLOWO2_02_FULL_40_19]OFX11198.1 MAG: hypothetical protein A3G22_02645 [Alphaproteobacteria bacterium RIFCSPLOWO2_12_FULL_40_11]
MSHHKFDIVVTAFPFIEKNQETKIRPAVIVSDDDYNKNTGFVVIAMVTSSAHSELWGSKKIQTLLLLL